MTQNLKNFLLVFLNIFSFGDLSHINRIRVSSFDHLGQQNAVGCGGKQILRLRVNGKVLLEILVTLMSLREQNSQSYSVIVREGLKRSQS